MEWNPETIAATATAITTILLAIFSKQILEFILAMVKVYRDGVERRVQQRSLDEELNEKGHKWIIRRQDKRITELETALEELRADHTQCREEYTALRVQYDNIMIRMQNLEVKLESARKRNSGS